MKQKSLFLLLFLSAVLVTGGCGDDPVDKPINSVWAITEYDGEHTLDLSQVRPDQPYRLNKNGATIVALPLGDFTSRGGQFGPGQFNQGQNNENGQMQMQDPMSMGHNGGDEVVVRVDPTNARKGTISVRRGKTEGESDFLIQDGILTICDPPGLNPNNCARYL